MRITITGINFKYDNGYDGGITGVEVRHVTSGFIFRPDGAVNVTFEEYAQNITNLVDLVIEKNLENVEDFRQQLEDYRDGLNDSDE